MPDESQALTPTPPPRKKKYVPAVGPRLQVLLAVVFGLFALIAVNSVYLVSVKLYGWFKGQYYENWFYLNMFWVHLLLGIVIILPVVVFGVLHIRNAYRRPNRRAVRVGLALYAAALLLMGSGVVLTRIEGVIDVRDPTVRKVAYFTHLFAPLLAAWLFVLHRLAGRRIKWAIGMRWAVVAGAFAVGMLVWQAQDPRKWNTVGNPEGAKYFYPSLARTVSGDFIPSQILMDSSYCSKCHPDVHSSWQKSVHRLSSFNNPPYLASVKETREFSMKRDGNVNASRFCAGCHDVVPFFSGAFNDPDYDMEKDPTAHAGVTCVACHSITHINSPRGNSDYTIDVPVHYPFYGSSSRFLRWVNEQLVKSKPEFHKKTFLKPLHKTTEFCGTCHKVHLPEELNDYKWLRGQNHFDAFWLSGVSGQFAQSFYYPKQAEQNCNGCHMKPFPSDDFAAKVRDDSGELMTLDHQFPSANTAVPVLAAQLGRITAEQAGEAVEAHQKFNEGVVRVDLFGLKEGGGIDGRLLAPLRPEVPALEPGREYLLETVIRTVKMGHLFTQGTADSNEVWMDVELRCGERVIGRSGGLSETDRTVDPWSHFVNVFMLDKQGNRINRRNAQDIFTPLYNNQIPPGAADVVHYSFSVPQDVTSPVTVTATLRYRKFDTEYMQFVQKDPAWLNQLPILLLATDTVTFPVAAGQAVTHAESPIPLWQRWNDYGIGLLRKLERGELRQAENAFQQVERLGFADGPINLARVYLKEGRVTEEAPRALERAKAFDPAGNEWSVLWFSGLVNKQNADFDAAIRCFEQIVEGGFAQAVGRGFHFERDYLLLNELGSTYYERAKQERGEQNRQAREEFLENAVRTFEKVLAYEPEDVTAHYNLKQLYAELGDTDRSEHHAALHLKYKPDDNARDQAIAAARIRYPAANHAAEAVVIYDLCRPGAFGLEDGPSGTRPP